MGLRSSRPILMTCQEAMLRSSSSGRGSSLLRSSVALGHSESHVSRHLDSRVGAWVAVAIAAGGNLGAADTVHRYGPVCETPNQQVTALVIAPEKVQVQRGLGVWTRRTEGRTRH